MAPALAVTAPAEADRASAFSELISDSSFEILSLGAGQALRHPAGAGRDHLGGGGHQLGPDHGGVRDRGGPAAQDATSGWTSAANAATSPSRAGTAALDDLPALLRAGLGGVRADAAVGEAGAIVQGVADRDRSARSAANSRPS